MEDNFNPVIAPGALARAEAQRNHTQEKPVTDTFAINVDQYLKRFDVNRAKGDNNLDRWRAELVIKAWLSLPIETREKAHKRALTEVADKVNEQIRNSPVVKGRQRKRLSPLSVLTYLRKLEAVQLGYVPFTSLQGHTTRRQPQPRVVPMKPHQPSKATSESPTVGPKDLALVAAIGNDVLKLSMAGRRFLVEWLAGMVHTTKERR